MHPHKTITRALAFAATGSLACAALAQPTPPYPLYSNGDARDRSNPGLSTGNVAGNGEMTPDTASWSEVQSTSNSNSNAVAGFSAHLSDISGGYRFADNFRINDRAGWRVDKIYLYAYQIGAESAQPTPCIFTLPKVERDLGISAEFYDNVTPGGRPPPSVEVLDRIPFPIPGPGTPNPFRNVNLRIWRGMPGNDNASVVWGDDTTNLLDTASRLNLYRIFNSTAPPVTLPDSKRSIWQVELEIPMIELQQGTYWLDWQFRSGGRKFEAFAPPITVPNQRGLVGWNARQYKACEAVWEPVVDHGKPAHAVDVPQDLPFIVIGKVQCPADFNDNDVVDIFDLLLYLSLWFAGDPAADLAPSPDDPDIGQIPDDDIAPLAPVIDIFDLLAYLTLWFDGQGRCPEPIDRNGPTPFPVDDLDPAQLP